MRGRSLRRARIVICVAMAASACGREASPVAPSPAFTPVTPPFAATYSGQLRVDTCQGCYRSSLGDVRPFVLRLTENAGGGFGDTLSFDYGASSKLIQVAGDRDTGGAFQLTGGFTPASPLDPGTPFELRSLLVREEPDGRLSGQGEYISGTPSATFQISIVSGAHTSNSTAQAGIDGTWIGQALVLECTGDPRYVCDSTVDVGELRYLRFDFTSAGGSVDAEWVDPPAVQ